MQYKRERTMFVKYNINIEITQADYYGFCVLLKSTAVRLRKSSSKRLMVIIYYVPNVTIHIILPD
jgi:hypothetical protein